MQAHVTLVGVGNYVRLEDGTSENRLIIALPNGRQISAFITDEDFATVIEAFAPPPQPTTLPAPPKEKQAEAYPAPAIATKGDNPFELAPTEENSVVEFGGDVPATGATIPLALPKRKSKLVGKDDAGNPIVVFEGAESPDDVTGTTGIKDEDGVAQL